MGKIDQQGMFNQQMCVFNFSQTFRSLRNKIIDLINFQIITNNNPYIPPPLPYEEWTTRKKIPSLILY